MSVLLNKLAARISATENKSRKEIRDRLSITGTAPLRATQGIEAVSSAQVSLNLDNFVEKFDTHDEMVKKHGLETVPRATMLTMLRQKKIDEDFTFKCEVNRGKDYIQAIRMVLSRTRRKALERKRQLDEFKLLVRGIKTFEEYDEVTLVRTKTLSPKEECVYDELMNEFEKPKRKE